MALAEHTVDLTASSPDSTPAKPLVTGAGKWKREIEETAAEDAARSRIMAFAKHAGATIKPFVPVPCDPDMSETPSEASGILMDANRNRIMEHAQQVNDRKNTALLAELHAERVARQAVKEGISQPDTNTSKATSLATPTVTVLTYNVWFEEEVALGERMAAIGDVIVETGFPTVICFQEVTDSIWALLSSATWMKQYEACAAGGQAYYTALLYRKSAVTSAQPFSLHRYRNSVMGRGRQEVVLSFGDKTCRFATSHLESPCGWNQPMTNPRKAQCKMAVEALDESGEANVIFAGDLNWLPADGALPLTDGWVDAWAELEPDKPGYTYDGKQNAMLLSRYQTRLDRVLAKLVDWKLGSIEMVGQEAISGVTQTVAVKGGLKETPVLPSDHFGLLFTMQPR
ncbi:probable tyrosyl-DNA phosphodiesterase 2 [Coccomyxa sp. Obi]|nr:probable tyrosyl-DNA phosphodiesterase 2 [Coccomyxa sp. Obi]